MSENLQRSAKIAIYYIPFAALCGIIFWLSSMSNPPIPASLRFSNSDKLLHAIAFGAVGIAAAIGTAIRTASAGRKVFLEAWILTGFYGFIDEIHQRYVPQRSSDIADWFADILGAAIGILFFFAFLKVVQWMRRFW
ncbi:MAG: VanZ family protein [Myxococcaceae bacterium]|nr:VanZ family protein [Myxococcaceae bacterium]MBH2005792.1 VanZ family protein [Myxococcaceae bacterium]